MLFIRLPLHLFYWIFCPLLFRIDLDGRLQYHNDIISAIIAYKKIYRYTAVKIFTCDIDLAFTGNNLISRVASVKVHEYKCVCVDI